MKKILVSLCLLGALSCLNSFSADAANGKKDKNMKGDAPADGSTITMTGMMAVKATDSKKDVVCRLTTGTNKMDKIWTLVATGETAKQLESMRQNGDKVKVTGKVTGDEIAVDKVERVVYMKK